MKEKVAREALSSRITHQQETYSFVCFFFKDLFPPYQVFFPIVFNDSVHLLLLSQLWPFPNHRWFFLGSAPLPLPQSPKPHQVPNEWGEVCGGCLLCFSYCFCCSPTIHTHTAGRNLLKYFLICTVRNLCWCAWVGDPVLFFVFLKKKKSHLPKLLLTLSST